MSPTMIAILLFVFGAAGLLANVLCGALIDVHLKTLVMSALVVAALSLACLALPSTAKLPIFAGLLLFAWGGAIAVVLVGLQTWTIKDAGFDALPASAIYVALFNAAIGLGAVLGSAVLARLGVAALFAVASSMTVAAIISLVTLREPERRFVPAE